MTTNAPRYGQVDREYARRLATTPAEADGPIWMVNLMAYKDEADYAGETRGITGREADDRYAPIDVLRDIGAKPVFVGDVSDQLIGLPRWDRVGVVRYPTRRSFIEMQARPDFQERHVHKEAGMSQTIVVGCTPIPSPMDSAKPGKLVDWADVPHPPTELDGPVMVVHLIRFQEGGGGTDMAAYEDAVADLALPLGVRISGWFDVEGTIVGDGRTWDQARFNLFPSRAAFMALALDPTRLEMQAEHRDAAIADTYTLIVRPTINRLSESVAELNAP